MDMKSNRAAGSGSSNRGSRNSVNSGNNGLISTQGLNQNLQLGVRRSLSSTFTSGNYHWSSTSETATGEYHVNLFNISDNSPVAAGSVIVNSVIYDVESKRLELEKEKLASESADTALKDEYRSDPRMSQYCLEVNEGFMCKKLITERADKMMGKLEKKVSNRECEDKGKDISDNCSQVKTQQNNGLDSSELEVVEQKIESEQSKENKTTCDSSSLEEKEVFKNVPMKKGRSKDYKDETDTDTCIKQHT